jgi:hypothetical protein
MDMVDSFRPALLAGVIVGIIMIAIGIFQLIRYQVIPEVSNIYFGVFFIVVGGMFFWQGFQIFRPIEPQTKQKETGFCPNCGALLEDDSVVCQTCKKPIQQSDDA